MELRYIQNISKESAEMHLYSEIGNGITAQGFVNELLYIVHDLGIPNVDVRVNSGGGSVIAATGIVAAIQNINASGAAVVNTYNDGVAASAAGFISVCGMTRYMFKHAKWMTHDVSAPESDDPIEQAKINSAKAALKDTIKTIISSNTKLDPEDVISKMDAETWLNAEQCLEMGIVDKIIDNTPKKRMAKNELYDFVNSIVKPNINKMNKVLNYFNLDETANEDAVIEKIEEVKAEADKVAALETENAELKEKLNAFEAEKTAKEEAEKEALAVTEVENAINAGKFDAAKKEDLIKTAKNDLEGFKNLVESIKVAVAPDITNLIGKGKSEKNGESRESWNILDWQKKDPNGLKNIIDNEPETYKRLYNEYYRPDLKNN